MRPIYDLNRQGLSASAIARKLGIDRKTVRKHLEVRIAALTYSARTATAAADRAIRVSIGLQTFHADPQTFASNVYIFTVFWHCPPPDSVPSKGLRHSLHASASRSA